MKSTTKPVRTKSPAVSVIVPAYNTEKYIADCLNSLLAQTFQNFEIICIDDGSTDNSLSLFNEYAQRDPRIKVISQKNQGVVAARNNAIAAARGEYILPLDSDDMIALNGIEVLYDFITRHDYAVVVPSITRFGELKEGKTYWDWPKPTRYNMYSSGVMPNTAIYPKKFWRKYGGYDHLFDKGTEDYDFWLNFFDDGQKIIRLPDRLYFYRLKPVEESRCLQADQKETREKIHANLRRKHPKIITYRFLYKVLNPLRKILRFFFRLRVTDHGLIIIRICKIIVWRNCPMPIKHHSS